MGRKRNGRGAASRTSPKRLQALEKQRQALQLRIAGANFDEIAESLGYANRGGAHKAIMTAIENTLREPVAHVRDLELKRLDRYMDGSLEGRLSGRPAGDHRLLANHEASVRLRGPGCTQGHMPFGRFLSEVNR